MTALLNRCLVHFELSEQQQTIAREHSEDLDSFADDFSWTQSDSDPGFNTQEWQEISRHIAK